jgi:MerR family mercuric resistance operon transcriptional regulator
MYTPSAIERIKLAKQLQALGLTLDEIIDALHAADSGPATCTGERWRLERVIEQIDAQVAQLQTVRTNVLDVLAACDSGNCRFADSRDTVKNRAAARWSTTFTAERVGAAQGRTE